MLTKERKQDLVKEFGRSEKDTGSCEVQVAFITGRISQISNHLKQFPKDKHSRRGLIKLVGRRKIYLNYIKKRDIDSYKQVLEKLNLKNK